MKILTIQKMFKIVGLPFRSSFASALKRGYTSIRIDCVIRLLRLSSRGLSRGPFIGIDFSALLRLLVFGFLGGTVPLGAPALADTSCAALRALNGATNCRIQFDKFRPVDWRLEKFDRGGEARSSLFPGKIYRVSSAEALNALSGSLRPGDQVVLRSGSWSDARLDFFAKGTVDHPVLVRAEASGSVVLTGASRARFTGSNILVSGIQFRDLITRNGTVLSVGDSRAPCSNCIVDRVVVDNQNAPPFDYNLYKTHYLSIVGGNVTVAHSTFTNKWSPGTAIAPESLPHDDEPDCIEFLSSIGLSGRCHQRLDFRQNVVSGFVPGESDPAGRTKGSPAAQKRGDYKFMQIGSSEGVGRSAFSILQDNEFSKGNLDGEGVSIKVDDVIIRRNRWLNNASNLSLRSADRVLVESNSFVGGLNGIRISGADHWIVNNRLEGLRSPPYTQWLWPILIASGAQEDLAKAGPLPRAKNITLAENVFRRVPAPPILVGWSPYPSLDAVGDRDPSLITNLPPTNVHVIGNKFEGLVEMPKDSYFSRAIGREGRVVGPIVFFPTPNAPVYSRIELRGNMDNENPMPTMTPDSRIEVGGAR